MTRFGEVRSQKSEFFSFCCVKRVFFAFVERFEHFQIGVCRGGGIVARTKAGLCPAPAKGNFSRKVPSGLLQKLSHYGYEAGCLSCSRRGGIGRGGYERIDGCRPYMVRAGKLRSRQAPPRPCRFGCRGARRSKWGHLVYETRLLYSNLSANFTDKETTVWTDQWQPPRVIH